MIPNSLLNIRQTPLYAQFMRSINWQVEKIDGVYAFIKKMPLLPAVIKIQRPNHLPSADKLKQLMHKYHARSIIVEPSPHLSLDISHLSFVTDPFIHTKTIHIDLTSSEQTIFNLFTSAKRRGVRRAQKLGVTAEISDRIEEYIKLKNRTAGVFLGFLTTRGITRPLWNTFHPQHARVILAYLDRHSDPPAGGEESPEAFVMRMGSSRRPAAAGLLRMTNECIAGILLLYINRVAYYWMAAATKEGKKLFAPTLLVWEALKFSKSQGCTIFDFEGVYDERFPKKSRDWQGFSRFKEGFGGLPVHYPQPFKITL